MCCPMWVYWRWSVFFSFKLTKKCEPPKLVRSWTIHEKMANIRQIWRLSLFLRKKWTNKKPQPTHIFNSRFVNEVCEPVARQSSLHSRMCLSVSSLWNSIHFSLGTKEQKGKKMAGYSLTRKKQQQQPHISISHTIPFSFRIPNGFLSFFCVGRVILFVIAISLTLVCVAHLLRQRV